MNTQTTDKYAAARKAWYDAWERAEAVRARRVIADRQDWRTLRNLVECEMVPVGAGGGAK